MHTFRSAPLIVGLCFVATGMLVGTGGAWLVALGGAWQYLPGGLVLVLIGLLLLQRNAAALWVHAGLLIATLAWSLGDTGLAWPPLIARGDLLFALGLVMLSPWVVRGLPSTAQHRARQGLATALVAVAAVGTCSWLLSAPDPHGLKASQLTDPKDVHGYTSATQSIDVEGAKTSLHLVEQWVPCTVPPSQAATGVNSPVLSSPLPAVHTCEAS